MTGNVSMTIAPPARTWSAKNVTIGEAGVGKQLTDRVVNMAYAMHVSIGLVYPIVVILVRSMLVPLVVLCALPLAVIATFVVSRPAS